MGIFDDECPKKAACSLHFDMRVIPIPAWGVRSKLIREFRTGLDGLLGQSGHPVGSVLKSDPMPMDACGFGLRICDRDVQFVAGCRPRVGATSAPLYPQVEIDLPATEVANCAANSCAAMVFPFQ